MEIAQAHRGFCLQGWPVQRAVTTVALLDVARDAADAELAEERESVALCVAVVVTLVVLPADCVPVASSTWPSR